MINIKYVLRYEDGRDASEVFSKSFESEPDYREWRSKTVGHPFLYVEILEKT